MLPGVYNSSVAWGDYDNDGRLDILLAGQTGYDANNNQIGTSGIYRNLSPTTNTPPAAPTGLAATVLNNNWVSLAWAAASDLQTPAPGLTYNLRIGSMPGGSDLLSPQSNTTNGFRRVPQVGNAQLGTNAIVDLPGIAVGATCYWSVQAVDSAWAGSAFAAENSFIVTGPPTAITLSATTIALGQATLQGSVNPGVLATLAWFEWGTDTNYGNFTPVTMLPSTNASMPISAALGNLTPGGRTTSAWRLPTAPVTASAATRTLRPRCRHRWGHWRQEVLAAPARHSTARSILTACRRPLGSGGAQTPITEM